MYGHLKPLKKIFQSSKIILPTPRLIWSSETSSKYFLKKDQGWPFPGALGYMPLVFLWAPNSFSLGTQNSMTNNRKTCFSLLIFIEKPLLALNLQCECQTLQTSKFILAKRHIERTS